MTVATAWVMVIIFSHAVTVIGPYTTEADCVKAQKFLNQVDLTSKFTRTACLPIGTITVNQ